MPKRNQALLRKVANMKRAMPPAASPTHQPPSPTTSAAALPPNPAGSLPTPPYPAAPPPNPAALPTPAAPSEVAVKTTNAYIIRRDLMKNCLEL